jgi:hypothetical protein
MALLKSRSLTVSINLDPKTVYEFIFNLENLFKWARKAFQSIKQVKGEWIAETAQGSAKISLTQRNDFGVFRSRNIVPMRVVQNGINGSE